MNQKLRLTLFAVVLFVFCARGFAEVPTVAAICERLSPSIVHIETTGGAEKVGKAIALDEITGTVLTADGLILTSGIGLAHQPEAILLRLGDGTRTSAVLLGTDEQRNISLLKAKLPEGKTLPVPTFAAKENFQVGQPVFALGRVLNPQAVSVTAGILSAKNRMGRLALQTDASTSANNYGGPLVDEQGAVMGILTPLAPKAPNAYAGSELYDSGVGFAIPIADIQAMVPRLSNGTLKKPSKLGVVFDHPNPIFSSTKILLVAKGSLAEKVGFKKEDVIQSVNGMATQRGSDVQDALAQCYLGDTATFVVRRKDQDVTIPVLLEKIEPPEKDPSGLSERVQVESLEPPAEKPAG